MKFIAIVSAFLFALVESRRRQHPAKVHAGCKLLTVEKCATNTQCHVVAGKCTKNKTNAAPALKHRRNY